MGDVAGVREIFEDVPQENWDKSQALKKSYEKFIHWDSEYRMAAAKSAMRFLEAEECKRTSKTSTVEKVVWGLSIYYAEHPKRTRRRLKNERIASKPRWRRLKELRPIHRLYNEILDANGL